MKDLPEEQAMFKEKQEQDNPKEDSDDNFVPAKEMKHEEGETIKIRVIL